MTPAMVDDKALKDIEAEYEVVQSEEIESVDDDESVDDEKTLDLPSFTIPASKSTDALFSSSDHRTMPSTTPHPSNQSHPRAQPSDKNCTRCGNVIIVGSRYCFQCGFKWKPQRIAYSESPYRIRPFIRDRPCSFNMQSIEGIHQHNTFAYHSQSQHQVQQSTSSDFVIEADGWQQHWNIDAVDQSQSQHKDFVIETTGWQQHWHQERASQHHPRRLW